MSVIPLLKGDSLCVFRGERLVLSKISLSLHAGEAMLLTGPNGAGKSTLLRVLAGLRHPDAGTLLWQGQPVKDDITAHTQRVAYLGHQEALKPGLTVTENLKIYATTTGSNIAEALKTFNLLELADLPARQLSAGQKRRTALARVLLRQAPLWLLDEPTLGLDNATISLLGEALTRHRQKGGMIIATSHVPLPMDTTSHLDLPAAPDRTVMPDTSPDDWTWHEHSGAAP